MTFILGAALVAVLWWAHKKLAHSVDLAQRAREHEWRTNRSKGWEG